MSGSRTMSTFITGLALMTALVAANYLASRHPVRWDLTQHSLYTLSPATRTIVKDLDDVVTLRVYMSGNLPPPLLPLRRDIDDMLAEFKNVSGGMIRIDYIDPLADPVDEQRALIMGIAPIQLGVIERDRQELAKVYLGMAVLHSDRLEVLPVIQSIATLEYRLVQAIVRITSDDKPAIGWWAPRDDDPVGGGYHAIKQLLNERYEIDELDAETSDKLDAARQRVLVIASPGIMGRVALNTIDGYLKAGGKVITLFDRWSIDKNLRAAPRRTDLTELVDRYGIEVNEDMVMDRSSAMASFAGEIATYHMPYPFWVLVRPEGLDAADPITGELGSLVLPWTSSIASRAAADESDVHMLARSTDEAASATGAAPAIDPESAGKDLMARREHSSYALALRLSAPVDLLVVGNGRFIQDNFLRRFPANAVFFENAVDVFAMSDKLIGIRSRIGVDRPIAMLTDGSRLMLRVLNVAAGPLAVVAIGIVVMIARGVRSRRIRAAYGRHP